MLTRKSMLILLSFILISAVFYKCSDDDSVSPAPPSEDLQYVGTWEGTSSQSDSLFKMDINSVGNKVMVTLISFCIEEMEPGTYHFMELNRYGSNGLAEVKNGEFNYSEEGLSLSAEFQNANSVSGNYSCNDGFGNMYEGSFTAHK